MFTAILLISLFSNAFTVPVRPTSAPECDGVLGCHGHGYCTGDIDSERGLYCVCDPGYGGMMCQIPDDYDETTDAPWCETQINCNGHGVCSGGVEDLQCNCFPGWYGVRCQIPVQ